MPRGRNYVTIGCAARQGLQKLFVEPAEAAVAHYKHLIGRLRERQDPGHDGVEILEENAFTPETTRVLSQIPAEVGWTIKKS